MLAFCGLGNPAGFRHTLSACGYEVAAFHEFPDHYHYTPANLDFLSQEANRIGADAVLCTQKDMVKINMDRLGSVPLWAVRVGIEFLSGRDELLRRLANAVASPF